jgi:pyruvate formate lyase activating enzyme
MHEASYYTRLSDQRTSCLLCPHNCIIHPGKKGICKARVNKNGVLYSEVFGRPVAMNTDPIEKKPLYHFYPGHQILSIGTNGCNLTCIFCQNSEISQHSPVVSRIDPDIRADEIISMAQLKQKNIGLAYTYNEPTVFFEYMVNLGAEIKNAGLKNVMVSNGFINEEPLNQLLKIIDAFNIDLKSFNNEFYKKYTGSGLNPVLNTIKAIFKSGNHLELTFLVIPGVNDSPEEFDQMVDWIVNETGMDTVLHISRYFPQFQMSIPPTSFKKMELLFHIAKSKLNYVYLGNVSESNSQNTFCPSCKSLLLKRNGFYTSNEGLDRNGLCQKCQSQIIKYMTI